MRPLRRHDRLLLPAEAYQTFAIVAPADTMVKTVCEEVDCVAWRLGWDTLLDESIPRLAEMATYIRTRSGRTFRELTTRDATAVAGLQVRQAIAGGITVFRFEPRQRCFDNHETIAEHYGVIGGDWRKHLAVERVHTRAVDWVEHFDEHLQLRREHIIRG